MQPSDNAPYIMQILRTSMHDGDGLRTVVYLKGCPLRCIWCHNPEGQSAGIDVFYYEDKCIKCGRCVELCDKHRVIDDAMVLDREGCARCGKCAELCPSGALSLCGSRMSPEELYAAIERDKRYYDRTGGGVTFSGGEALLYPDYLSRVLSLCKQGSINTAIESAMHVKRQAIDKVIDLVDCWMVDIKHMDSDIHKRLTGKGNEVILENIAYLAAEGKKRGVRVIARTPLVPGCNDDYQNLLSSARFARESGCSAWQILRYNDLGQSKYTRLGEDVPFDARPQIKESILELVERIDRDLGEPFAVYKP